MDIKIIQDSLTIFLGIIIEATPFILLGVIASSIFSIFVKEETLVKLIPKDKFLSLLFACGIGFLFPVCECGNIPFARRLILKGLPPYLAVAFLIAAPTFNPIVIFATYVAFKNNVELVGLRILITLLIAIFIGYLISRLKDQKEILSKQMLQSIEDEKPKILNFEIHKKSKIEKFLRNSGSEFFEMFSILAFGGLIASIFQIFIPRSTLINLGNGPISSVLSMMALAMIVSICSNVDSFFALGFVNNFTLSSILSFLLLGPIFDIKTFFMINKILNIKSMLFIFALIFQIIFLITAFINLNIS